MEDGIAAGHSIVIDMEGSTLSHLAKINIIALKKFMFYIQVGDRDLTLLSISQLIAHAISNYRKPYRFA